jgi:Uma2 family endonuclease
VTAVLPDPITEAAEVLGRQLTPEEYEELPPNPRLELVEGVLHIMPPATGRHQDVVEQLRAALRAVSPRELRILREQEVRIRKDHRRNPDLMAINAAAYNPDGYSYKPEDVLLAVEVVSPGTQIIDSQHKPAEYAAAGIAHYWRVEIKPRIVLHTYQLGESGRYLETGLFVSGDVTAIPGLPWAKIAVTDLEPEMT